MDSRKGRPTLAILVNLVAPYRVPVYRALGERFRTFVFSSGAERNRTAWASHPEAAEGFGHRRSAGISVPFRTGGANVYDEKYLHLPLGQLRDLRRTRPDAIITIEMGARTLLALLYGTLFRIPVWVWWGGTLHTERRVGRTRALLRAVISRWATRYISYGETSTEYLHTIGVAPARIVQIQNCVDESRYSAAPIRPTRAEPVFLYVGQMIRRKGVDRLLAGAALAQREGCSFTLRLVGDGPERHAFMAMARELDLANVEFLDATPPGSMPDVYRQADFLVFPTLEDVWGLVVNEALLSGLPVLSSIHAGCARELLPAEQTFDPEDARAIADVLIAAAAGRFGPPDTGAIRPCREVGDQIAADVERELAIRRAS